MIPAFCGWHNLGDDLQLKILSIFTQGRGDKDSLNTLLQTSRSLRTLVSSLIHKIEVRSIDALAKFPRHATITAMRLNLLVLKLPAMLTWLVIASSAGTRLNSVTDVAIEQHRSALQRDAAAVAPFINAIGLACPNLRGLEAPWVLDDVRDKEPTVALFTAIGLHLPNITSLKIRLCDDPLSRLSDLNIDWASSLPRGLQTLHLSNGLHHELLQHLLQMPHLKEVHALSIASSADGQQALQSDACGWRKLQLLILPSFRDVCRFTKWPAAALMLFPRYHPWESAWELGPPSLGQTQAVAKAATRLATCSGSLLRGKPFVIRWGSFPTDPASSAGIISALAPMAGNITAIGLDTWAITAALFDELEQSLPHTNCLNFHRCTFTSEAWLRLLTLTSVTALNFHAAITTLPEHQVQLLDVVAFTLSVPRAMKIYFQEGCMCASDLLAWKSFLPSLATRRTLLGVPPVALLADLK